MSRTVSDLLMRTFSMPMFTSRLSFDGFSSPFDNDSRMARRMKSCWRLMRPRSPLGSVRQTPRSSRVWNLRLRT